MLKFNVLSYSDPTGAYSAARDKIAAFLDQAADKFNEVLITRDTTIDVAVSVDPALTSLAYAGAAGGSSYSTDRGLQTIKNTVQTKIFSGYDGTGANADANLSFSVAGANALVGQTKPNYDFVEVMEHEMLHAMGISGFRSSTGELPTPYYQFVFDSFVQMVNGKAYFTGPSAVAMYGGDVPMPATTTNRLNYHLDVQSDVMYPTITPTTEFSLLDVAVLRDLGYTNKNTLISPDGRAFLPGGGAVSISGTAGTDKVVYAESSSTYTFARSDDKIVVTNKSDTSDVDTLQSIERIQFTDRTYAFDVEGNGGQAYRLYQAAFNRRPDLGGLGYQMNALDKGLGLKTVAQNFINSQEFQAMYGTAPSEETFVKLLYSNVLHREPDSAGFAYQLNALQSQSVDRAQLLVNFSESAENKAALIGVIGNGFEYSA